MFIGLDPAKPLFAFASSEYKLDSSDADFVDVIHTDVVGRGMLASLGHVDFYPNLGTIQPGCDNENPKGEVAKDYLTPRNLYFLLFTIFQILAAAIMIVLLNITPNPYATPTDSGLILAEAGYIKCLIYATIERKYSVWVIE